MKPQLSQTYIKSLLNYDPEAGSLTWKITKSRNGKVKVGDEAGYIHPSGRYIRIDGQDYSAGILIWMWMYNHWPRGNPHEVVDHIDGNSYNNKLSNLRLISQQENAWNRQTSRSSRTGFRGIHQIPNGKYQVYIAINGYRLHLGFYNDIQEAIKTRKQAELQYFGEYAPKD